MSKQIRITGVTAGGTPEQPNIGYRLDAEDFVKDEKRFSLYIQAMRTFSVIIGIPIATLADARILLERLYDSPENEDDSHFQIGGIHSLPFGEPTHPAFVAVTDTVFH